MHLLSFGWGGRHACARPSGEKAIWREGHLEKAIWREGHLEKMRVIVRMGCRLSLKESSVSIFRTSLLIQNVFFNESPVCIQACTRWPALDGQHSMASFRCNVLDAMYYNELPVISAFRRFFAARSQNEAHRRFFDRVTDRPSKMPNHKRRCSPPELGDFRNQSKEKKARVGGRCRSSIRKERSATILVQL